MWKKEEDKWRWFDGCFWSVEVRRECLWKKDVCVNLLEDVEKNISKNVDVVGSKDDSGAWSSRCRCLWRDDDLLC